MRRPCWRRKHPEIARGRLVIAIARQAARGGNERIARAQSFSDGWQRPCVRGGVLQPARSIQGPQSEGASDQRNVARHGHPVRRRPSSQASSREVRRVAFLAGARATRRQSLTPGGPRGRIHRPTTRRALQALRVLDGARSGRSFPRPAAVRSVQRPFRRSNRPSSRPAAAPADGSKGSLAGLPQGAPPRRPERGRPPRRRRLREVGAKGGGAVDQPSSSESLGRGCATG